MFRHRSRHDRAPPAGLPAAGRKLHAPAVARMREHQTRRVEKRPLEPLDGSMSPGDMTAHAAVQRIAHDRVADRAQVHADLVRPARVNRDVRQRQHAGPSCSRAHDPGDGLARLRRARADIFFRFEDRVRWARRSAGRPAPRPRRARRTLSQLRDRETGATSSSCAASCLATTIKPDVPRSRRWTMPGRFSPPMPLRSSRDACSAFTSVPPACPAAGCTTIPAGLSTTTRSRVLVENRQRQRFGLGAGVDRFRHVDRDLLAA